MSAAPIQASRRSPLGAGTSGECTVGGDEIVLGDTAISLDTARAAYDSALTDALGEEAL